MRSRTTYIKVTLLSLLFAMNLIAATTHQALAALNAVFGTLYYVYVAYSE